MAQFSERRGALYVIATPIGNVGDLSPRAREIISHCDGLLAEDTRKTLWLLRALGIRAAQIESYHDHNAARRRPQILSRLQKGQRLGLVSDAGTPLIADPGYKLVREARAAGIAVIPVPGPCAAIAALSVAGIPTDRFYFGGFLPEKTADLKRETIFLETLFVSAVYFTTARRVRQNLEILCPLLANRQSVLARELTKNREQFLCGSLGELLERLSDGKRPARPDRQPENACENPDSAPCEDFPLKGEMTLLIAPAEGARQKRKQGVSLAGAEATIKRAASLWKSAPSEP